MVFWKYKIDIKKASYDCSTNKINVDKLTEIIISKIENLIENYEEIDNDDDIHLIVENFKDVLVAYEDEKEDLFNNTLNALYSWGDTPYRYSGDTDLVTTRLCSIKTNFM